MYLGDKTTDGKLSGLDVDTLLNNLDIQGYNVSHVGDLTYGSDPRDTISESTSPKGFDFSGGTDRDLHNKTVVTITNGSSTSVTETITVELYDGTDTTGTLVSSESKSVSVSATTTTTVTFITADKKLDTGTYHINITQSGTTLSIDKAVEHTKGATYTFGQTASGDLFLRDQDGIDQLTIDAVTEQVSLTGELDLDNGLKVEGSTYHNYAGIKAGGSANNGHLMVDGNGGNLYLNWDERNNDVRVYGNRMTVHSGLHMDSDITMNGYQIHTSATEVTDGAIDVAMDSSNTSGQWIHAFNFNDTAGTGAAADVSWARHADSQHAMYIYNHSLSNRLFTIHDSGDIDIPKGELFVNNGISVEGSTNHSYAGVKAGPSANNGHLMLDSNGGNLYLNWHDTAGEVRIHGSQVEMNTSVNMKGNDIVSIHDIYSKGGGRVLLRAKGTNGQNGLYDDYNNNWYIKQNNGGNLSFNPVGEIVTNGNDINLEAANNTGGAPGLRDAGYVRFENEETTNVPSNEGTIFWDNSAGFLGYHDSTWQHFVTSNSGEYRVEKNGTDGTGIINFKT